ncbi:hypothetical protein MesoLj113c_10680 [Mesorhizobium sp. 113-3-9]|nr:hypothetical protein MesoLj113c_10680 [Mesorhizobium sp. 113-3-9]
MRETNRVMSGPGVIARITVATANWISVVVSGMKDMEGPWECAGLYKIRRAGARCETGAPSGRGV